MRVMVIHDPGIQGFPVCPHRYHVHFARPKTGLIERLMKNAQGVEVLIDAAGLNLSGAIIETLPFYYLRPDHNGMIWEECWNTVQARVALQRIERYEEKMDRRLLRGAMNFLRHEHALTGDMA
jgi:hypothetical protein